MDPTKQREAKGSSLFKLIGMEKRKTQKGWPDSLPAPRERERERERE